MIKEQGPKRITLRIMWSVYYRILSYFFVMKLCLHISKTKIFRKLTHRTVVRQNKEVRQKENGSFYYSIFLKDLLVSNRWNRSAALDQMVSLFVQGLLTPKKDGVNMN